MLSRTVPAALGESFIAAGLEAIQGAYPDVVIGSYPQQTPGGGFTTEYSCSGRATLGALDAAATDVAALVERAMHKGAADR